MGNGRGALGICARAVAIATTVATTPAAGGSSSTATTLQGPNPGKCLGALSGPLGHCLESEMGRIAASLAGSSLLELSAMVGLVLAPCIALVDSGVSHCFIVEHIACTAGLSWDAGVCLVVRLADRELRPCLGLARAVHV